MEIPLTPDQEAFIKRAVSAGRFSTPEDAVREALALWEERERVRAEILAAVDTAEASLGRGEGRTVTETSMRDLAEKVKQKGRSSLNSQEQPSR
jgi:antitoxin ParD1/3/4